MNRYTCVFLDAGECECQTDYEFEAGSMREALVLAADEVTHPDVVQVRIWEEQA